MKRILLGLLSLLASGAYAQKPAAVVYQAGYNPTQEERNGVGTLPEESWGEARNGLQAGLSVPATLKLNQRAPIYLVVRNVSDETIRFSGAEPQRGTKLNFFGDRYIYEIPRSSDDPRVFRHHQLEPGQQTLILANHLQIMAKGQRIPAHALKHRRPGLFTLTHSFNTAAPDVRQPDGTLREATRGPREWTGFLRTANNLKINLLAEEVPFSVQAPPELPKHHGLGRVEEIPGGWGTAGWHHVQVRDKLLLHIHRDRYEMFLDDYGAYQGHTIWGPITVGHSVRLGLLDRIRKITATLMDQNSPQAGGNLLILLRGPQPFVTAGLELVPLRAPHKGTLARSLLIDRTIRDRRLELYAMGLKMPVQAALQHLRKNDPPLPGRQRFNVINPTEFPPHGLTKDSWGPEIDGLQAAALMPKTLKNQELVKARLFLRNVSVEDLYLAVSTEGGYDHATVSDRKGQALTVNRPSWFPTKGGLGNFAVEINPGELESNPPRATLTKLLLKPGAIWELQTDASLGYNLKNLPPVGEGDARRGITHFKAAPGPALVTWHLHTANGEERNFELTPQGPKSERSWPTRGSWTGLLETAPVKVHLAAPINP